MLVIVKHRDIAFLLEFFFYLKAARRADIFKIDSAKASGQQRHSIDNLVGILAANTERECVYPTERFKKHAFAFHNGHSCLRANIPQAENCRAVRYYRNKIVTAGIFVRKRSILFNLKARRRNARRIGNRQVLFIFKRYSARHFYFTLPFFMHFERFFFIVHQKTSPCC